MLREGSEKKKEGLWTGKKGCRMVNPHYGILMHAGDRRLKCKGLNVELLVVADADGMTRQHAVVPPKRIHE